MIEIINFYLESLTERIEEGDGKAVLEAVLAIIALVGTPVFLVLYWAGYKHDS